jgi:polysaccharide export outer membrane protein
MNFKNFLFMFFIFTSFIFSVDQGDKSYSYSIGPKDLLTINVFEVPELNITVRVSEDGSIVTPLLGNINVAGLTRFQLEKKLVKLLEKNYLKSAQVTVFIKEYQSKLVSVIGAVKNPGNYELVGRQTLLQMISIAGGLTEAASDRIVIIRQYKNGKSASLVINLDELMLKGNPKLNIPLQAADIINISVERYLDIYVFGQVKKPGHIKMKKDGNVTLLRVIAQAGGFSERARKSSVLIKRKVNGKEMKIKINVKKILRGKRKDFILENNDIVHVPESML